MSSVFDSVIFTMASMDCEESRHIDRIRAITFREARDAGAKFISRSWVANILKRSEKWVQKNWNKNPYDCKKDTETVGRPAVLSQESKNVIEESVGKQRKSVRKLSRELELVRGKKRHFTTIYRELKSSGKIFFHVIKRPNITRQQEDDRLWFCDEFLKEWDTNDFLHLACSDEFFIYTVRKPNTKNDVIWATNKEDIDEDERFREMVKFPECIGVFLCFTAKRCMWVVKDKGQSWDGEYFRENVLKGAVIPFLQDPENVISVEDVTFLHDKAPCFKALKTQDLLRKSKVDFFSSNEYPGGSPDLNACEHLGSILKDRVEERLHPVAGIPSFDVLEREVISVLTAMEEETSLFVRLLESYPRRVKAVVAANGGHTKY